MYIVIIDLRTFQVTFRIYMYKSNWVIVWLRSNDRDAPITPKIELWQRPYYCILKMSTENIYFGI